MLVPNTVLLKGPGPGSERPILETGSSSFRQAQGRKRKQRPLHRGGEYREVKQRSLGREPEGQLGEGFSSDAENRGYLINLRGGNARVG